MRDKWVAVLALTAMLAGCGTAASRPAAQATGPAATRAPAGSRAAAVTLAEAEREHILGALRETGWVVAGPKGAAARLGMKRSTLQEKMRKLGISRPQ